MFVFDFFFFFPGVFFLLDVFCIFKEFRLKPTF